MTQVRPFLATIAAAQQDARPLGGALRAVATAPATSPWSPSNQQAAPQLDTRAIEEAARERGREQGMAETAELRAQLTAAIAAFTNARQVLRAPLPDQIAGAAVAILAAWTETAPGKEVLAPIVRAWLDKHTGPATAHVAPAHVTALAQLVGDAAVTIEADPAMRAGDVRFSAATLELAFAWERELANLRHLIAAALEAQP